MNQLKNTDHQKTPQLSIVVIAFNEAAHLAACLQSVRQIDLPDEQFEVIFVDGGSTDTSMAIAQAANPDHILGSDSPRRAALNRNAGLHKAQGEYIQFVDGDMELDPLWPEAAIAYLKAHPWAAALSGTLQERNNSTFYQALQLDWENPEGPVLYCGGAALFHRETLLKAGGFPEDVNYGEEPLLCWYLRNEHDKEIHHIHARMAHHDLAYTGLLDYLKRNIRVGETYMEIAKRLEGTQDPLWANEIATTVVWTIALLGLLLGICSFAPILQVFCLLIVAGILARKTLQRMRQGIPFNIAIIYSIHIYSTKLTHCYGMIRQSLR